ncbi:MAG TPA: hypothetical protein VG675_14295 [Bryobacteraceae bacterium]|nr:hypothetical protein [Bryobacteraceae bacterium]
MISRRKKPAELVFRIDTFTPETLPLDKLTQYLVELAAIYGDVSAIHFKSVEKGSAALKQTVEPDAVDPLKNRLEAISRQKAAVEAMAAYDRLDILLRRDECVAHISLNGAKLLTFKGRNRPVPEVIGPVIQLDYLDGELIRVGGRDATVPVHLRDVDGVIYPCTANIALAKSLGPFLYSQVRLVGTAHWFRHENGEWQLDHFRVDNFKPLDELNLVDAVTKIRETRAEWDNETLVQLNRLRGRESDD